MSAPDPRLSPARRRALLVVLGLGALATLLLSAYLRAPDPVEPPPPGRIVAARPARGGPGRLAGIVVGRVRTGDGAAVSGASVVWRAADASSPVPGDPLAAAPVTTDEDGRFRLAGLPPGSIVLAAWAEGRAPAEAVVAVETDRPTQAVLTLGPLAVSLEGVVRTRAGAPVAGAAVGTRLPGRAAAEAVVPTDAQGRYRLWLRPGAYTLTARAAGLAPATAEVKLYAATTQDLVLPAPASIAGRAIDEATGRPAAGARVWLAFDTGSPTDVASREVPADANGAFRVEGLAAGNYRVFAQKDEMLGTSGKVIVGEGEAVTGIEVSLGAALRVRGRLLGTVDGRAPVGLPEATLTLTAMEGAYTTVVRGPTEPDGGFALGPVPAGRYRLDARAPGHLDGQRAVDVRAGAPPLEWTLDPAARLEGRVVSGGDQQPVPEAQVRVIDADDRNGHGRLAHTDEEGRFVFDGLPPGKLQLSAQHPTAGLSRPAELTLATDRAVTVTLALQPAASIAGTVRVRGGGPAAGARVIAVSSAPGRTSAEAEVDEQGAFLLGPLPPGPVTLVALAAGAGPSRAQPEQRAALELRAGERRTGIALVVPRGGLTIEGEVRGPDGRPALAATVIASREGDGGDERGPGAVASAETQREGRFTLGPLDEGRHLLQIRAPGLAPATLAGIEAGRRGLRVVLAAPGRLAGVALDAEGRPVPGPLALQASSPDRADPRHARAEAPDGAFALDGLGAGAYELVVRAADGRVGKVQVRLGPGERREDLHVRLQGGVTVTGSIVDLEDGRPLPGIRVHLLTPGPKPTVETDAAGVFALGGFLPGETVAYQAGDPRSHVPERGTFTVPAAATGAADAGVLRLLRRPAGDDRRGQVPVRLTVVDDRPVVTTVTIPNATPLGPGDVLLSIDGRDTLGMGAGAATALLQGPPGEAARLRVQGPAGPVREVSAPRVGALF